MSHEDKQRLEQYITDTINESRSNGTLYGALFNLLLKLPVKRYTYQVVIKYPCSSYITFIMDELCSVYDTLMSNREFDVCVLEYTRGSSSSIAYIDEGIYG